MANGDNHLKNLSFKVSAEGIELAPAYDLLSTGAYHTRAIANERADWPATDLAIPLPGATTFGAVTRESVLDAGQLLGIPKSTGARHLDRLTRSLPTALDALVKRLDAENAVLPQDLAVYFGGENRLVATVGHLIVPDMLARLRRPPA